MKWLKPMQMFFASPAAPLVDSGAPPATAGGGTPAAAPPATPSIDWKTAPEQFRSGYEKLKSDYEKLQSDLKPWQGLNVKPEEVGHFQQSYQQVYTEIKSIGESLGIEEREIADAIRAHGLVPVLDQLRAEAQQAEAAAGGDQGALSEQELEARIQAGIETRLSPVLQRENQRIVAEANMLVENTITQLATDAYKAAGIDFVGAPPELKNFVLTGVTEALKYDDEGMQAVKFQGKTAAIQRAFQTFTAMWDAAYLARRQMESKMPVGADRPPVPPKGQPQGGKQPSIDEIINDPNVVRTSQGRPAYST